MGALKPKQWVERLRLRCADELHVWLLEQFGFDQYVRQGWWRIERTVELPFDFWWHWWRGHGQTVRFRNNVRAMWCPLVAEMYEDGLVELPQLGSPSQNEVLSGLARSMLATQ